MGVPLQPSRVCGLQKPREQESLQKPSPCPRDVSRGGGRWHDWPIGKVVTDGGSAAAFQSLRTSETTRTRVAPKAFPLPEGSVSGRGKVARLADRQSRDGWGFRCSLPESADFRNHENKSRSKSLPLARGKRLGEGEGGTTGR